MRPFRHILVPTDFGPASSAAIDLAIGLAQAFEAQLTLLHVWEIPDYPYLEFMRNSPEIARVEDAAVTGLAEGLRQAQTRLPTAKSVLRRGVPWQTIISTALELECDLIVMGTHGLRGLSRALLGSVTEKVVRVSPVPVLTVHAAPANTAATRT
ncbi:MAG TPA: universal stress protein [Polyangiaceae bacterium]|nr:universal stress protein [Polyangiaceae bacterium]